jgi:hypothetical protein
VHTILRKLAGPALLLLICAGFYWKLTLTSQYTWLDGSDMAVMDAPRLQFMATEFHRHHFPLWDPYHWMGQPFLGQFTGLACPTNWLLAFAPMTKAGKLTQGSFNWYFVLIRYLGALFCYLLCRDLKLSRAASILAGCVFVFGGLIGSTDWPEVINGLTWAPLVFLFLLRAQRGERPWPSAALSGMFLGIAWLAGHHELPIYLSVAAGGVWLAAMMEARRQWWRVARLAAVAYLFTFLTGAFQTLPGYEFGRHAVRWAGVELPLHFNQPVPYLVHAEYSNFPTAILGIAFSGFVRHVDPFIGVVALALAVTGVVLVWRKREVRVFALVALFALLFSMAVYNVFHGLLYAVLPVFGKARLPARILGVFSFAVAPLVAYGLDQLREAADSLWVRRLVRVLAIAGGLYFVAIFLIALGGHYDPIPYKGASALYALLAAAALEAARRRAIAVGLALLAVSALVVAELGNSGLDFPNSYDKNRGANARVLTQNRDIAAFLRKQPGPVRANYNDQQLRINFGDWEGIDTAGGFTAAVTENIIAQERHLKRGSDLLAINYWIGRESNLPNQQPVFEGETGLKVFRNPDAFPRTWSAHEARAFPNRNYIIPAIQDPAIDLRRTVLLTGKAPQLQTCDPTADQVRYLGASVNRVTLSARLGCRGIVVLADTWFPGWRATVDGKSVPILEVYGAIRGVVVEGGTHRIEFRYLPATAVVGGILSLLGMLGAIGMAVWPRRRQAAS